MVEIFQDLESTYYEFSVYDKSNTKRMDVSLFILPTKTMNLFIAVAFFHFNAVLSLINPISDFRVKSQSNSASVDANFEKLTRSLSRNGFKKFLSKHNHISGELNVVFVRHGLSCANVMQRLNVHFRPTSLLYSDPELSNEGRLRCENLQSDFKKLIDKLFPHNNYILGSSTLLRAQETAYRMTKTLSKPIAIMPFVAEKGMAKDVTPKPRNEQIKSIEKHIDPKMIDRFPSYIDFHGYVDLKKDKSDPVLFMKWLQYLWVTAKQQNIVIPKNFIIFTHSRTMASIEQSWDIIHNNGAMLSKIYLNDLKIVSKRLHYSIEEKVNLKLNICPSSCLINPCMKMQAKTKSWMKSAYDLLKSKFKNLYLKTKIYLKY